MEDTLLNAVKFCTYLNFTDIIGSEDTPYVGGIFKLDILIPER